MARAGWHQARRVELSDRQEEVLRLIAAGRTNYEIAQELGVSLEGAKYHVREIMTKLGVDSREEAADWWRRQRRPMARLRRALGWWPVWAGAGGIAVLGAVGLVVFLALLNSGGEGEPIGAAPTAALTAENAQFLIAIASEPQSQTTGLRVFASDGSFDHTFPGYWAGPAWSPDGRFLAVFGSDGNQDLQLHIFERDGDPAGWIDQHAQPPLPPVPGTIRWANDSSKLAIFSSPTLIYDNKANLLVNSGDLTPMLEEAGFISDGSWSPDNRTFAATAGNRIVVVYQDGTIEAIPPPEARFHHIERWTANDTLAVVTQGPGLSREFGSWTVQVAPGKSTWTSLGTANAVTTGYEATVAALGEALSAQYPQSMMTAGLTADGNGIVNTVMPSRGGSGVSNVFAIVRFDGKDTRIELGAQAGITQIGRTYDAVIVPKE